MMLVVAPLVFFQILWPLYAVVTLGLYYSLSAPFAIILVNLMIMSWHIGSRKHSLRSHYPSEQVWDLKFHKELFEVTVIGVFTSWISNTTVVTRETSLLLKFSMTSMAIYGIAYVANILSEPKSLDDSLRFLAPLGEEKIYILKFAIPIVLFVCSALSSYGLNQLSQRSLLASWVRKIFRNDKFKHQSELTSKTETSILICNMGEVNRPDLLLGETLMHTLAKDAKVPAEFDKLKILVQEGGNIHIKNHFEKTPLDYLSNHHRKDFALELERLSVFRGTTSLHLHSLVENNCFLSLYSSILFGAQCETRDGDGVSLLDKLALKIKENFEIDVPHKNINLWTRVLSARQKNQILFFVLKESNNKLVDQILNSISTKSSKIVNQEGYTPITFTINLRFANKTDLLCLRLIKTLLQHGAKPDENDQTSKRNAPLHYAVQLKWLELFDLLVENKANPSIKNRESMTPLHFAAKGGSVPLTRALLELGADPNAETNKQWLPLHFAANRCNVEIMKMLLNKGSLPDSKTDEGWTPLHFAAQSGSHVCISLLLEKSADPNGGNNERWTPLHLAAKSGNDLSVKLLLEKFANSNAENDEKWTPLHFAAQSGNCKSVELLLKGSASSNAENDEKWSPLHFATLLGNHQCVQLLLNANANPNSENGEQWTPLHFASKSGSTECGRLLLDRFANPTSENDEKWTPIHFAALGGNFELVRLLLEKGADPELKTTTNWTSLHCAAKSGNIDCVSFLLEYGSFVNSKTDKMWTPLHFAAESGSHESVAILLEKGAEPNMQNEDHLTPLHFAAKCGSHISVKLLLDNGADMYSTTKDNRTPLHFAADCRNPQCIKLLIGEKTEENIDIHHSR